MAKNVKVQNQTKNDILTITGGWLRSQGTAVIEDWEAVILADLYGSTKVVALEMVEEPKETKKKKK